MTIQRVNSLVHRQGVKEKQRYRVFFVKPHPPLEILYRNTPVPESYKYAWEPVVLKLFSTHLKGVFGERLYTEIWHLIKEDDERLFLERVLEVRPDMVVFTEIDVLVNQVSRLATKIKQMLPEVITVVGGKQSSLLRVGDRFPFRGIDLAIRGDGITALEGLIGSIINDGREEPMDGLIDVGEDGRVLGPDTFSPRAQVPFSDNARLHQEPVFNHPLEEYLQHHHNQPSLEEVPVTAPIFTGTGCPFNCFFCQSPVEYGDPRQRGPVLSPPEAVAGEIAFLREAYGVNHFFSLEPNLNLKNLNEIYTQLESTYGIDHVSISGFIRAGDIPRFYRTGLLQKLVKKGLRVVSIGLDISLEERTDSFNKSFGYNDVMECLRICEELGIIALSTYVARPDITAEQLERELRLVRTLPVAEVDVRIAMALRNTPYFKEVEPYLISHPDRDPSYFDRQNYRYQSIYIPGYIEPEETYRLINQFYNEFYTSEEHLLYVRRMLKNHPETYHYFRRQYETLEAPRCLEEAYA